MNIVIIIATNIITLVAFYMGYKLGCNKEVKEVKDAPIIKIPSRAPKLSKEEKEKQEAYQTLFSNIDNYDGTNAGQREVKGL